MSPDDEALEYVVNANDVIVQVNETWERFAEANEGEEVGRGAVGTWLWQHLSGKEVKHLYRVLLERVRATGRPVSVPFRCDAPHIRRSMMMEVAPLENQAVRFSSWTVEEKERPPIEILAAGRDEAGHQSVMMCAWCKRIEAGDGVWHDLEEALARGDLLQGQPLPRIIHAVCPDCRSMVLARLDEEE
jgi:hypothetical protein